MADGGQGAHFVFDNSHSATCSWKPREAATRQSQLPKPLWALPTQPWALSRDGVLGLGLQSAIWCG